MFKHKHCQHVLASPDSLNAAPHATFSIVIQSNISRCLSCLLREVALKDAMLACGHLAGSCCSCKACTTPAALCLCRLQV